MGMQRGPSTVADPPPAYRYVTRFYGRSLRPIVLALALITAIWALAWTVSSFKELKLSEDENLPKLAPLMIAQGVLFAVACLFQTFGIVAAWTRRLPLIRIYAFLCALSTLMVIGIGILRVITHFEFKSDLISECISVAETGAIGPVFGIWGSNPAAPLDSTDATAFCNDEWNRNSLAEIVALILEIILGVLFTSLAFAYYRQARDPTSPANTTRLPTNQARREDYPSYYNPPYDTNAYIPVYLPPPGPPPGVGKPPEYRRSPYVSYGGDKDTKEDDPFSDRDGPAVPMPTHWVEDRDATSPPRA